MYEFRRFSEDPSDGKENKDKDTDYKEMRIAIFFVPLSEKKNVFIRTFHGFCIDSSIWLCVV